ncbi:MAG: flagellin [Ruminococcus sp.]|jgi:flagellin|nr:flagellin [Ruminococcus sp.]
MVVRQNLVAENAMRYNSINTKSLSKKMEKLSSGYKINRAGDNAAGLAVSEKMRAQAAGLTQAVKNAEDGISMIQTFEGALNETHKILNRIKTLATQSANGIYSDDTDRAAIELEYEQLLEELDDISETDFNGVKLIDGEKNAIGTEQQEIFTRMSEITSQALNGTYTDTDHAAMRAEIEALAEEFNIVVTTEGSEHNSSLDLQVGGRTKDLKAFNISKVTVNSFNVGELQAFPGNGIDYFHNLNKILSKTVDISGSSAASSASLGIGTKQGCNLSTQSSANIAIDTLDNAINKVSMIRATFGSTQNRLEHKIDNLSVTNENITAAESRIRDTNVADEVKELSKAQILAQASQAMLAQANQLPQNVIGLLQ